MAVMSKRKDVYKRQGLGMAITQNIVRMMNGTIEVKSALGTGSQFIVAVPFDLCLEAVSYTHLPQPVRHRQRRGRGSEQRFCTL